MRSPYEVILDLQILVEEVCWIGHICLDTPDFCCRNNDIFWLKLLIKLIDCLLIREIEFVSSTSDNIGISFILKVLNNSSSDKTSTSCYIDF